MSLLYEEFLVIDIEATCWRGVPPKGMENEILEIGVAVVDVANAKVKTSESIIVKPKYSQVSKFCTKLTGITKEEAAKGVRFNTACRKLREKYNGRRMAWGSWGDFDHRIINEQCERRKLDVPVSKQYMNIRVLYSLFFQQEQGLGLKTAMQHSNIDPVGREHDGEYDAINCARLLCELLKRFQLNLPNG